jgi:hypothetical protein
MSEVVIDGFVTYLPCTTGDSWAAVRAQANADSTSDGQGVVSANNQPLPSPTWSIARSVMQFPTVALAGETIQSVDLELFVRFVTSDLSDVVCHIVDKGSVADSYPFPASDRSLVGSTSFGSVHIVTAQYPDDGAWVPITLSAGGIAALNLAGDTIFCAREAHDLNNVEPDPEVEGVALHRLFWEFDDSSIPPCRLRVTVADVPPPPPPEPPPSPIDKTLYCDWTSAAPTDKTVRNWCPDWSTPATSMALSRRPDGSLAILFGTCDDTGRILRLDSALHNDDGAAIEAFYQTAFGGGSSGRNSVQYLTASVAGDGMMSMSALLPDGVTSKPLRDLSLQETPSGDTEWSGLRINAERVAWRFGTFEVDGWFKMRKLAAWARAAIWSKTRGTQT